MKMCYCVPFNVKVVPVLAMQTHFQPLGKVWFWTLCRLHKLLLHVAINKHSPVVSFFLATWGSFPWNQSFNVHHALHSYKWEKIAQYWCMKEPQESKVEIRWWWGCVWSFSSITKGSSDFFKYYEITDWESTRLLLYYFLPKNGRPLDSHLAK